MDTTLWQQPVVTQGAKEGSAILIPLTETSAEIVAQQTQNILAKQGYCLWKCQEIHNEIIMIVDKEMPPEAPSGYPVYTREELEKMDPLPISTVRLINHVKKTSGATVMNVFSRKQSERKKGVGGENGDLG